jgi:predicted molibdopterin-dependent oxidoreductase YjgC
VSPTQQVTFEVQGHSCQGIHGESLLDALRRCGFEVPALCHHPGVKPYGACRLCLVEVQKGRRRRLVTSCDYPLEEGLQVFLDTEKVVANRRMVLRLLLAMAPQAPRIRRLAAEHGVEPAGLEVAGGGDDCILCGLCVRVCREVVGAEALSLAGRGLRRDLGDRPFGDFPESCIGCGACAHVCPTGAISMEEIAVSSMKERWGERRPCRYALMGLTPGALCENDYECWRCEVDQRMVDRAGDRHPVFLKLEERW